MSVSRDMSISKEPIPMYMTLYVNLLWIFYGQPVKNGHFMGC